MTEPTPLEIALEIRGHGWWPTPVKGKIPILTEWQNRRIEPETQPSLFNGTVTGAGVILGLSGLKDLEADCHASELVLNALAPETDCIWHRGGRHHRLYECAEGKPVSWDVIPRAGAGSSKERLKLVELRGGNEQSVFPGSLHPSGQRYEWVQRGTPACVTYDELVRVALLAAVAGALSHYWPGTGTRHDVALAAAGYLRRTGVTQEEATCIVWAAASAAGDDENGNRLEAVATTYARAETEPTTGLPRLEELCGEGLAKWLAKHLPSTARVAASAREEDLTETTAVQWPDPLGEAAFAGLAGDAVRTILPHTEADPAALLAHFLIMFGNVVGHDTYFSVGAARHTTNTNAVMVGRTAKGRKGTALEEIKQLFKHGSPLYVSNNIASGLSSGEGLIFHVRDPIEKQEPVREQGRATGEYQTVVTDPGVTDKRLLAIEPEFASVLRVATRDGSTLSTMLRQAWDSGDLRVLTRHSPLRATGAHISVIGHITKEELVRTLDRTDAANGFANRFLWFAVRKSKELPDGGRVPWEALKALGERLEAATIHGREVGEPHRDATAAAYWREVYSELCAERDGMLGLVTSRAEAQVVRLSLIYALLDCSGCIRRQHIESAMAVWRYCEASAAWIFGAALGNPTADATLAALREAPDGLTRTQIRDLFTGHRSSGEIGAALNDLAERGLARCEKIPTGGRSVERWYAL
jgi:hypothetical protein